jgi:hypothetical protein
MSDVFVVIQDGGCEASNKSNAWAPRNSGWESKHSFALCFIYVIICKCVVNFFNFVTLFVAWQIQMANLQRNL